jgi:hypothetical protein
VKDYKYCGTIQTNKNELRQGIEKMIIDVNRAYYILLPLLRRQLLLTAE